MCPKPPTRPNQNQKFQNRPPSTQSHSVPRDISGTTRCPAGRGALGLTPDQKSGPRVSPSGSGALPTDEYRKRITFSDAVKCAQTAPVTSNSARTPCAQLLSAQSSRAKTQTLRAQTPCAQKQAKKSKKSKFSKIQPPRAQLNLTPPAVASSAFERENAKGEVIAELTRQSQTHCNQLGAATTGPKFFVDARRER